MATSQNSHTPRRRPSVGDRSGTGTATPPGTDPTPDSTNDTGHPNARGTLPMARHPFAPPTTDLGEAQAPAPAGVSAADRAIMRARLAVMAAPRDSDDAELAALRAVLRDEALMAHVIANVERWPPLTEEQRETIAASQPGAATGGLNRMATHDDGAPTDSGGAPWCPGRLRGAGGLPSGAWVRCPPRSGRTPPASPGRQDRHGAQPVDQYPVPCQRGVAPGPDRWDGSVNRSRTAKNTSGVTIGSHGALTPSRVLPSNIYGRAAALPR